MEESYLSYDSQNNNNLKFEINYFYNLDSENKICFDCGGAFPCFISINNGVFICKFCAENHKNNLNYNISYIRDVNSELDQYLLSFITRGGNSRFKRLCNQYEIPCMSLSQNNSEKLNKYIIRLGEYHRLVLKSEINCSEPPPPLYREVAHNPIDINIIYFPEFENYRLFKGNNMSTDSNKNNNNEIDESMTSKIWEGTKNTFDIMKTTGGFIYKTGKPIVSFLGNAAFSGIKYLGSSVWNYYMNNNEKGENNKNEIKNNNSNNMIGNNTPINNNNNSGNYINNYNYNNNESINYNNVINNNNNYNQNKNYLSNSNKFNIFTINEVKPLGNNNFIYNNNIQNIQSNIYSKPINNQNINNKRKNEKENQIPNYYDINSINNESVNNISLYMNKNNNENNSINNISKIKCNLLNHENIIINNKYINNKNLIFNSKNIISGETPCLQNKNNNDINNSNFQNNNYPNYSMLEKNINNNNIYMDKNTPNIIGEELYQEKDRYPIYQSTNLLNENIFTPSEFRAKEDD